MTTSKADAERILDAMLPFAEKMLRAYGEFIPFGAAMKSSGEVVSVAAKDNHEQSASKNIIDLLKNSFRASAKRREYKATGIFYDVKVIPPSSDEKVDAVAIALDHEDNFSVIVYYPYRIESGEVRFGQVFATEGDNDIFGGSIQL